MKPRHTIHIALLFLSFAKLYAAEKRIDTLSWSTETALPRTVIDQQIDFMHKHNTSKTAHSNISLEHGTLVTQSDLYIEAIFSLQEPTISDDKFNKELVHYLESYRKLAQRALIFKNSLAHHHVFNIINANFDIMNTITRDNIAQLINVNPRGLKTLAFSK